MKYSKPFIALTAILIFAGLYGCNLNTSIKKIVTPEIRAIGLPTFDIVDSVTLKVSGPGMDTVEVSYSVVPSAINLSILEGENITFELTVDMSASYPGTIASYKGSATADILSDGTVVTLNMGIGRTKIIIPDANNNRIVQINNINGDGWSTKTHSDLGFPLYNNFIPYDIDFDQYGNIYIANSDNYGIYGGIYVINSLYLTFGIPLPPIYFVNIEGFVNVTAVAVDKHSNRVYGIATSGVYYWDAPGNYTGEIVVSGTPEGLHIDNDGNVYVSGTIGTGAIFSWIGKYSSTGTELASYTGELGETINDITISNGELYATITISSTGTTARIEKFDPNTLLHPTGQFSFGQWVNGGTGTLAAWDFLGPYNFLATMNNELTMIDYQSYNGYTARLVSFNVLDGSEWTTFGSYGSAEDQFTFFN